MALLGCSTPGETVETVDPCEGEGGCFLEPCNENGDCQSGWCVEHMGDGVCARECHVVTGCVNQDTTSDHVLLPKRASRFYLHRDGNPA